MIKEEDLVVVIENGVLKKGKVKYIANRSIAIVWLFDDKQLKKVPIENITLDSQEEKKEKTPVEKESITITSEEFWTVATEVITEESLKFGANGLMIALIMGKIMAKIHTELFSEVEEGLK